MLYRSLISLALLLTQGGQGLSLSPLSPRLLRTPRPWRSNAISNSKPPWTPRVCRDDSVASASLRSVPAASKRADDSHRRIPEEASFALEKRLVQRPSAVPPSLTRGPRRVWNRPVQTHCLSNGWLCRWRSAKRALLARVLSQRVKWRTLTRLLTSFLFGAAILVSATLPFAAVASTAYDPSSRSFTSDPISTLLGDQQRFSSLEPSPSYSKQKPPQPESSTRRSPKPSNDPQPVAASPSARPDSEPSKRTPSHSTGTIFTGVQPPVPSAPLVASHAEHEQGLRELQRNLLRQGLDPFRDWEGVRQIHFYKTGQDLARVPGSSQFLEQQWQQVAYSQSYAHRHGPQRQLLRCWVNDLERRGILDPLEYFQRHPHQLERLHRMTREEAQSLATEYETNLQRYGRAASAKIEARKAVGRLWQRGCDRLRQCVAAGKRVGRSSANRDWFNDNDEDRFVTGRSDSAVRPADPNRHPLAWFWKINSWSVPTKFVIPTATIVLGTGLALLFLARTAFTQSEDDESAADEDFQRLYTLLTGDPGPYKNRSGNVPRDGQNLEGQEPRLLVRETTLQTPAIFPDPKPPTSDSFAHLTPSSPEAPPSALPSSPEVQPSALPSSPETRQSALPSNRNRDLYDLVSNLDGPVSEFARLLAKVLAAGAPDRLDHVHSLSGGALPLEFTTQPYDKERTAVVLSRAREASGLSEAAAMELFDQVVKCLVTDVVEMETSWLQGRDSPTTVKAINDVVDFMAHVSSVYEALTRNFAVLTAVKAARATSAERAHSPPPPTPAAKPREPPQRHDSLAFHLHGNNGAALPRGFKSRLEQIHDTYSGTGGLY